MRQGDVVHFPRKVKAIVRATHLHKRDEERNFWKGVCDDIEINFDPDNRYEITMAEGGSLWHLKVMTPKDGEMEYKSITDSGYWEQLNKLSSISKLEEEIIHYFVRYHFPEAANFHTLIDMKAGSITFGQPIIDTSLLNPGAVECG